MSVGTDRLPEAIRAARECDYGRARTLLARILIDDPDREEAWLWLSQVVESVGERRECLQHVLRINPENGFARRALSELQAEEVTEEGAGPTPPSEYGVAEDRPDASPAPVSEATYEDAPTTKPPAGFGEQEIDVVWSIPVPESGEADEDADSSIPLSRSDPAAWTAIPVPERSSMALARRPQRPYPLPRRRLPWPAIALVGLMLLVSLAAVGYLILRSANILPRATLVQTEQPTQALEVAYGQYQTGLDGSATVGMFDGATTIVQLLGTGGAPISGADLVALSDADGLTIVAAAAGYRPFLGTRLPTDLGSRRPAGRAARALLSHYVIRLEEDSGLYMEESSVRLGHMLGLASRMPEWTERWVGARDVCSLVGTDGYIQEAILFTGTAELGPHLLLGLPGTASGQEQCFRALTPLDLTDQVRTISAQEIGLRIITIPGHVERGVQGLVYGQVLVRDQLDGTLVGLSNANVWPEEGGNPVVSLANGWYYMETRRSGRLTLVAEQADLAAGPITVDVLPEQVTLAPPLELVATGQAAGPRAEATSIPEPLSDRIAFSARMTRYESALFLMKDDGSEVVRLAGTLELTGDFAWSPDGEYIAAIVREEAESNRFQEIYLVPADGTEPVRVTQGQVAYDVAWAPDARRLAFSSRQDGNRDIYTIAADGSGLTRLTTDPADDRHPVWSADGALIAFLSDHDGPDGGSSELYIVSAAGGERDTAVLRRLTVGPGFTDSPEWSPDGTFLVYSTSSEDGVDEEIFLTRADGSQQFRLADVAGPGSAPTWSPDGKWIAYHAADDLAPYHATDIFVVPAWNGVGQPPSPIRLTDDPADDFAPAWSPDGRRLAFVSGRAGSPSLYTINLDGTGLTYVTTFDGQWQSHAWQPRSTAPARDTPVSPAAAATAGPTGTPEPPSPTPAPTTTPTSVPPLPDLVVRDVRITYEGERACVPWSARLGTAVEIENAGQASAGPFLVEANGLVWLAAEGLEAGGVTVKWIAGAMLGTRTTIVVDVDQQVIESNEDNNTFSQVVLLPPLPPPCEPD